jgi:hypothetical protein
MTEWLARLRFTPARALLLVAAMACVTSWRADAAEVITIQLDQARIAKLPENVGTLIIGNPLIADVTLEQGGTMILTGKGYGVTNLIALDRAGALISEQSIEVRAASDTVVVVYRGVDRESYSCTPVCERRITLGDSPQFFNETILQAGNRSTRAASASRGAR